MENYLHEGGDIEYYINYNMEPLKITKIIRVGDSLGIIIPKELLESTALKRGDQVFLAVREDLSLQIIKNTLKIIT